jgi:hypothetical protein
LQVTAIGVEIANEVQLAFVAEGGELVLPVAAVQLARPYVTVFPAT